jgi:transcription factor TFIIIB component B''
VAPDATTNLTVDAPNNSSAAIDAENAAVQASAESSSPLDKFASVFQEPVAPVVANTHDNFDDLPSLPLPHVNPLDAQDANDQALVLAAEAAAALLDVDVGESIDAAAILGVNVPTTHADNIDQTTLHESAGGMGASSDSIANEEEEETKRYFPPVPALPPLGHDNPLGPNIKTFTSEPPKAHMSCVHSNFLQYYYNNEAVGVQHALSINVEKKKQDDDNDNSLNDQDEKGNNESEQKEIVDKRTLMSFCSKYPKRKEEKVKEESVADTDTVKSVMFDKESTADTAIGSSTAAAAAVNGTINKTAEKNNAPQVEIIDGEMVVRNSTLFSTTNRVSTSAIDDEFGTAIEEDESTALGIVQAKYDSYTTKTRSKPSRWGVDETRAFYKALRQCGSDFSMMQMFLPGRTRSQLKSKFKLEQRRHPRLVDMALDPKKVVKLDLSVFGELEIPDEVTPISIVQPQKGEEAKTGDDMINETPAVEEDTYVIQTQPTDMDRIFDHLFDDNNEEAREKTGDDNNGVQTHDSSVENQTHAEATDDKQPALLLAPVVKPKVKRTKKFKAKPAMAKKASVKI